MLCVWLYKEHINIACLSRRNKRKSSPELVSNSYDDNHYTTGTSIAYSLKKKTENITTNGY